MKSFIILCAAVFSFMFLLPTLAFAQREPDSPCYLRQSDGTVVDLSRLCVQTPKPTLSPNAGFDSNFRSLANSYPPNIRQELNQYGNEYRDSMIASAKTTCRVLRYGGSNAVLTRMRTLAAYNPSASEAAKQQVAYALAVNQYCPDAANR
jgi:hypothetical protein